jgi:dTDP-4-amino-4,6-dideoxygalactose transaminase
VFRIPLVDLITQHRTVAAEIERGFARVFEGSSYILGDDVAAFEEGFAAFSGVKYCVGVGSGTDALELMLRAGGVGMGDEVIVPTSSFIATAAAVVRAGAKPVLVDADPLHHLIDVGDVRRKISPRTKAILPVHLYGQMAPMEELQAIAADANVLLFEDAAQAHGAKRHGTVAGGFGLAAAISFYPGKNLGAYGDAGAVLTDSEALAAKVRRLRNYGSEIKYQHPEIGFNTRLDSLQAVVLNAKLKHLPGWNQARLRAAERYDALLADVSGVIVPRTLPGNEHVWHLYVVRAADRDRLVRHLNGAGIGAAVHYPIPIHLQEAFRHPGYRRGDFPAAEAAAKEVLSLPLFPEITPAQQACVVDELKKALQ